MTWKQFKEAVEAGGITDEMDLWYIDVSFDDEMSITPQDDGEGPNSVGFVVTN